MSVSETAEINSIGDEEQETFNVKNQKENGEQEDEPIEEEEEEEEEPIEEEEELDEELEGDEEEDEQEDEIGVELQEEEEEDMVDEVEGEEEEEKESKKDKKQKKVIDIKKSKKKVTLSSSNYNIDDELFTEYQDFEKIDETMKKSYIQSYHPEIIHKNYDEMMKLTFLKRDNKGIIKDELHKTIPFLTKYEKTKIIGLRVKQLNSGAKPFINLQDIFKTQVVLDTNLIAERELELKKIPFIIARPITNKHTEYWNLKDLELI